MSKENTTTEQPRQPQFVEVEIGVLQAMLDYLKTRPYQEVYKLVEILTGRGQVLQQQSEQSEQSQISNPNRPEGFDSNVTTGDKK